MEQINFNVLIEAINDYFFAEESQRKFLKTWVGGWWPSIPAERRLAYREITDKADATANTVDALCRLADLDPKMVFAIVKAFNRYEKRTGYQKTIFFPYLTRREQDSIIAFVSNFSEKKLAQCYESTGRKINV